jgi:hypothetical protein
VRAFTRAIRSKRRRELISTAWREEVYRVLDEVVKPTLVREHEEIVADWESDVSFAAKKVVRPDSIRVYVFPTGKDKMIWIYVDQGTDPHPIDAVRAPRLAFMAGVYVPKTLPGAVRVQGGGYVKNPVLVMPVHVDHPGNKPRLFSEAIAENNRPFFRKQVELAFRRAAWRANGK